MEEINPQSAAHTKAFWTPDSSDTAANSLLRFYGGEGVGCAHCFFKCTIGDGTQHARHGYHGPTIGVPATSLTSPQLDLGRSFFTAQRRRQHHLWHPPNKISQILLTWSQHFSTLCCFLHNTVGGPAMCEAHHLQARSLGARFRGKAAAVTPH